MSKTKNKAGIHLHKTTKKAWSKKKGYSVFAPSFYWNLIASNGREIARSSETYSSKAGAVKSIKSALEILMINANTSLTKVSYYDHSKKRFTVKKLSMSDVSIEQMNEVISEFMELKRSHGHLLPVGKGWCATSHLQYHSSWDWLMPVVEKIEMPEVDDRKETVIRAAADVKVFYKACIINYEPDGDSGDKNEETIIQTRGETKLEAVFQAVYQFIQWYNKQKEDKQ
jgi:hypothetical protein